MTTDRPVILLVDDEPNILELSRLYLEAAQFRVITAATGTDALAQVRDRRPDLVVLDLMLPDVDGWQVCRAIRQDSDLPIIMLTARTEDVDKIVGLELGADDYVTKPFNPRELAARIRAVLRRASPPVVPGTPPLRCGDLTLDAEGRMAAVGDRTLPLRAREFDLLHSLLQHRDLALTRDQLLRQVWGYDFPGETRTVDVHIASLRKALADSDVEIETVWGIGYRLHGPPAP